MTGSTGNIFWYYRCAVLPPGTLFVVCLSRVLVPLPVCYLPRSFTGAGGSRGSRKCSKAHYEIEDYESESETELEEEVMPKPSARLKMPTTRGRQGGGVKQSAGRGKAPPPPPPS